MATLLLAALLMSTANSEQKEIPRIAQLPNRPTPYAMRDWAKVARDFDRLVFDEYAQGKYLPLVWRIKDKGFGMPSYVGAEKMRGDAGESLTCLGAVLGTTVAGIDKAKWLSGCEPYYNPREHLVLNNPGANTGSSFWYEILPSIYFAQISTRYPKWTRGREISKRIADTWINGIDALDGNYDHTSFDFRSMKPVDNGKWKEPEAAAGIAYLELLEGIRSSDSTYLKAARKALDSLQTRTTNPTYEALLPYGTLAAAYLNAEHGDKWDLPRFLDWCFEPTSPYREGWGMIVGRWGDYDAGGLIGSTTDSNGYAFAMNTYLAAATLAPISRYDARYSKALAKWILNLANASRLYYRNGLPPKYQDSYDWEADPKFSISYEGLRHEWKGDAPYATGDAKQTGWSGTNFGLYGAGTVGLLAALVKTTNVPRILRIDLRATDFLPVKSYSTELIWNPYEISKTVRYDVGKKPCRLYDAVDSLLLTKTAVEGRHPLTLAPGQVMQVVKLPATGRLEMVGGRTKVGGVVVDYKG